MSSDRESLAAVEAGRRGNSLLQALNCLATCLQVPALAAEMVNSILLLKLFNRFPILIFTLDSLILKKQGLVR